MKGSVTLQDGMHFTGTTNSNFTIFLDAKAEVGGQGKGSQPLELMLISLIGCTGMDVISILRKKRQKITHFEVKVEAERSPDHPKVFTDIKVVHIVHGEDVDPRAVERAIQLSAEIYCPAQAMLSPTVPISHTFEIVDSQ